MPIKADNYKFIDLDKSIIDKEKSDAAKGRYVFHKKVYYKNTRNIQENPWKFSWQRNSDRDINEWMILYGYELVKKDARIVPEGVPINAEGNFQLGDLVLMRCSMVNYATRKIAAREAEENFLRSKKSQLQREAAGFGAGLTPSDEEVLKREEEKLQAEINRIVP